MSVLAVAVRGDAIQYLVLGLSCFAAARLLLDPPPASSKRGTPHGVSLIAWLLVLGLISLTVLFGGGREEEPAALSIEAVQFACLESILVCGILMLALDLPRLLGDSTPVADEQSTNDTDATTESPLTAEMPSEAPRELPKPVEADLKTDLWSGVLVGLAGIIPAIIVGVMLSPFLHRDSMHPFLEVLKDRSALPTVLWISLAAIVVAPIREELMFRVILQGRLVDRYGSATGIAATAAVFAAVHRLPDAISLVPFALMLGVLYEHRRSLLANIVAHAVFNAANIAMVLALSM